MHPTRRNGSLASSSTAILKGQAMVSLLLFPQVCIRWTPHSVIVTIGDNRDYIRVLLYAYYTTITGWGVLLRYA